MCSRSKSVWFKFQSTLDRTLRSQPPWHIYIVDAPQVLGSPAFSVCWGCPVGRQVHWLLGLQLVHSQDLPMPNHLRWQRAGQSCRGFHTRQLDSPWLSGGTFLNLDFNLILTWLPLAQAEEAWKQRQGWRMDVVELTFDRWLFSSWGSTGSQNIDCFVIKFIQPKVCLWGVKTS